MGHIFPVRVYFSDTDAGNIVYHARYLDFAEHARTELLREISAGRPSQSQLIKEYHQGFVVKSLSITYHNPALLDDMLQVITTVDTIKKFSLEFVQRVVRISDQKELATLRVKVASIDLLKRRPIPLEQWLIDACLAL